jgi:hypothetical protein
MPKRVLPAPAVPAISEVRPRGRPPPVISSKPAIPVGALARVGKGVLDRFIGIARFVDRSSDYCCTERSIEQRISRKRSTNIKAGPIRKIYLTTFINYF